MHFFQNHKFQFLDVRYKNYVLVQKCFISFQFIIFHFLWHLTLLYLCYQFLVLQICICIFQNSSFNISLVHANGCSMWFMHSPTKRINHFILFSSDMLDIKVILKKKLQPPTMPIIQGWMIEKIFQTIMVCSQFEPLSHEVMPPFLQTMNYGCQL